MKELTRVVAAKQADAQAFLRARESGEFAVLLESEPAGEAGRARVAVHAIGHDDTACRIGELDAELAAQLTRVREAGHSIEVAASERVDGPDGCGVRIRVLVGETPDEKLPMERTRVDSRLFSAFGQGLLVAAGAALLTWAVSWLPELFS